MNKQQTDFLIGNRATGNVAQRLLNSGFNIHALKPFMENGQAFINNASGGVTPVSNATLRKDEWLELDQAVLEIATQRMVGVTDLVSRGLVYNVTNGLGTTVLEYEDQSDLEDAEINMTGQARGAKDRLEWDINYLPLPIIHKDFSYSIRTLAASRNVGQALDTATAQAAARKVAEKIEEILFTGASSYAFGGGTLYGYTDFTHRNTYSIADWDASTGTGELILADVIAMKQASIDDRHYGPWGLYIPTNFEAYMDEDFKANSDKTVRQRILEIEGIEFVRTADKLTASNVVLVELSSDTVRIVNALAPQVVEWDTEGGMITNFKVMAIQIPQLRADQDDRCGIVHGS